MSREGKIEALRNFLASEVLKIKYKLSQLLLVLYQLRSKPGKVFLDNGWISPEGRVFNDLFAAMDAAGISNKADMPPEWKSAWRCLSLPEHRYQWAFVDENAALEGVIHSNQRSDLRGQVARCHLLLLMYGTVLEQGRDFGDYFRSPSANVEDFMSMLEDYTGCHKFSVGLDQPTHPLNQRVREIMECIE